jgi:hypothetical protein
MRYILMMMLFVGSVYGADPLMLSPAESVTVHCAAGAQDCPKPYPGNRHAVVHPSLAAQDGGASCRECHGQPGEAVTQAQTMLCSQYDFRYPGIVMLDPNNGNALTDPVSGTVIVSGGGIAGYDPGMDVACRDCHYPHASRTKVEDRDIHEGCLDCHRRVGSDDVRRGIDRDD